MVALVSLVQCLLLPHHVQHRRRGERVSSHHSVRNSWHSLRAWELLWNRSCWCVDEVVALIRHPPRAVRTTLGPSVEKPIARVEVCLLLVNGGASQGVLLLYEVRVVVPIRNKLLLVLSSFTRVPTTTTKLAKSLSFSISHSSSTYLEEVDACWLW